MRILNVIMCLDPIAGGGAVERIYQLSKHLALAGHECTILTTRQGWDETHVRGLGNVHVVDFHYISERYKIPLGLSGWLKNHLADFDVIHLALNWTMINAVTYHYLRKMGRPYVMSAMGSLTVGGRSRLFKRVYKRMFTTPMLRNANICIAITRREVDDYLGLGVDAARIARIPNGIDPVFFSANNDAEFHARYGLDARPIILFVGRIDPIKGPDMLLRAFQRVSGSFPNHQLVIVGNDVGFLPEMKGLTRSLGMENKTSFLDPIVGVELSWAYHAAQLFVIPSRYDTMTIVALGAAASGTPILLTDRCDFGELQEAGGGLVVDCSVEGLENGLRQLLTDPVRLKLMGQKAREFVVSRYRWEYVCQQFIRVFQSARAPGGDEGR